MMKCKKYSNKSNSYSIMNNQNKNNILINIQKNDFKNIFEFNYKNIINGGESINNFNNRLNEEKHTLIDNTNNDKNDEYDENEDNNEINENNNKNKKYKLLNEEMMKKIKNTVDDNLKKMFNFSYENFLSKESEQESKDYVMEKER